MNVRFPEAGLHGSLKSAKSPVVQWVRVHGERSFNLRVLLHSERLAQVKGRVAPVSLPSKENSQRNQCVSLENRIHSEISVSP